MPINPSIALGAAQPQQQQNPFGMLAQLLQIQQLMQKGRQDEMLMPLQMKKLEAEIANIPAQEAQRRAAAEKATLDLQAQAQQMQGRNMLSDFINPQGNYWSGRRGEGATAPMQLADSNADALAKFGLRMNPDGTASPLNADNTGVVTAPMTVGVKDQGIMQSLLARADPSAFVRAQTTAMNRPPERPQIVGPGAAVLKDGKVVHQQPFAPRAPGSPVVVMTPDGPRYTTRDDAIGATPPPTAVMRPPAGYRFSADGETLEPIPGGPRDKPRQMPTAALKMQQTELDAIGTAASINADMGALSKQIDDKKLDLGLISNTISKGRTFAGLGNETSRNYASFRASLEKLRNDSLRLNKGVQTEGDAVRAWNELISNLNDSGTVKQRLGEIQKINERAIALRQLNIDQIRGAYGIEPLDTSAYSRQPPTVGGVSARPAAPSPTQPADTGAPRIVDW